MLTETMKRNLELIACTIRKEVVRSTHAAKSGHPGGSLGAAEIFTLLYFNEMNIDPKNPTMADRDRFVLSKGHAAPAFYAALAHKGYFPTEDLTTLRKIGSHLQGHPSMRSTPGVDMSTGSLGQGISAACGMALGAKLKAGEERVYALLGDGEIQEGECWEAFMFASHYKLDNLCVIIDVNGLQIDGNISDVMNPEPIDKKMESFGFAVFKADGNDLSDLYSVFSEARGIMGRPSCIIARTIKGKGVSFMENVADWHGKAPNDEECKIALTELDESYAELRGERDA